MKKHTKLKITLIVILTVVLAIVVGGTIYVKDYYHSDESVAAILNNENVQIEKNYITFGDEKAETGIIFYPGGKVEHTAYAPLMNQLADKGCFVVLVKMPFNLAVFDIDAADEIRETFGQKQWYIGGHSLGGAMANSNLGKQPKSYQGLILLGAYLTDDLSAYDGIVVSIYGSEDQVLNKEKYDEGLEYKPSKYYELVLSGGNHCQFGNYGFQKGDGIASISASNQQQQTSDFIWSKIST